jgi:hypothetical protein
MDIKFNPRMGKQLDEGLLCEFNLGTYPKSTWMALLYHLSFGKQLEDL